MKSSTADTPPAGPSAPATTLPRAEGTLRLLTRQGYAESGWFRPFERSTGCRVEVRYADGAESLRRRRRLCVRRRVDPGRRRLRRRPGRRGARAQPGARAAARQLPGAVPRSGGSACRAPPIRRLVHVDAAPRAMAQINPQARAGPLGPARGARGARRGRLSLEDAPLEIGGAALSSAPSGRRSGSPARTPRTEPSSPPPWR